MTERIENLFARDVRRRIEDVIKVEQTDEEVLREELSEYVVTPAIRRHYAGILDRYAETPNKPHEGVGIWVSGFFGSGKSSFAKTLGLAISNRTVAGEPAARRFVARAGDPRIDVLLAQINERIPTHAVIFDVSTHRGIRTASQTLTHIMYRLFLESLGYAHDLDLAELEMRLEEDGQLDAFRACFRTHQGKEWDERKRYAIALQEASAAMHELDPRTYPDADSWREANQGRADVTPGELAERCKKLLERRRPGHSLLFVVDEVGQFVARDVQKMLDLQAVVQSLGRVGRGKLWLAVTSQEKLGELVGGLDDRRVELARLMDRFPQELQVHLEPSDISEVTSQRVLSKNASGQAHLRELFERCRGQLAIHTRLTADIRLPELTADGFIDLYPLLPYQVDLIIQVVSGLRTQGGVTRHLGGANRTIIKLAQQILVNPAVNLAEAPVGSLVTLDQVYELVEGNLSSEVRAKIATIPAEVGHPLAQAVAKAICLLQYAKSVHRTAENLAAVLHPAVDASSRLPEVRDALAALVQAQKIREGEDGYRIPTPAEDDWERQRASLAPRPADITRLYTEAMMQFWQPQPQHSLRDVKVFKAGLAPQGRLQVEGDVPVHVEIAEEGADFDRRSDEARARSRTETRSVFWVAGLDEATDREAQEVFRSKEMLARKERQARTAVETALVAEEKQRLAKSEAELRRRLRTAFLRGSVFFRGYDRSPDPNVATDVGRFASELLGTVLPAVFTRFEEAAAKVQKKDIEALQTAEDLRGLTPVFTALRLLRDEGGKPVIRCEEGPLAEVLARIQSRTSYGEVAGGRWLETEFAKEPFGWDFDVVRLFLLALLRAGKVEVTSRGQTFDSAAALEAKDVFTNNNLFRQASFREKAGLAFEHVVRAGEAFRAVFGSDVRELEQGVVAQSIKEALEGAEEAVQGMHAVLVREQLPGAGVLQSALEVMRGIRRGNDANAIVSLPASQATIREAIQRGAQLEAHLTEPRLKELARARDVLARQVPVLLQEQDLGDELRGRCEELRDLLSREAFFRELPAIDQHAAALGQEYDRRYREAVEARARAYEKALEELGQIDAWTGLDAVQRQRIAGPLEACASREPEPAPSIALLRADLAACPGRLATAIEELHRTVDGERVVALSLGTFFSGAISTEEELDAALSAVHEECTKHLGAGKKVLLR